MNLTPGQARTLASWWHMIQRCNDPSSMNFGSYGGRGIAVCLRWLDPWIFLADMGERPEGLSLGRIDNEGDYHPANCRWETDLQQARNTRRNVFIHGQTQSQVAEATGLSEATVMRRRRAGLGFDKPPHFKRNKLNRDDVAAIKSRLRAPGSNVAIAKEFSVSHTLIAQIRRGRLWGDV